MDTKDLISISQAARDLGLSRGSVYDAIARGDLSAVAIGGRQLVSKAQVDAYVPRAYEGKRDNQRLPGQKGPSRWDKARESQTTENPANVA